MPRVHETWHGDEIMKRAERAIARANISIAEQISAVAKTLAHVDTGTLKRSIHASKTEQVHSNDQDDARLTDLEEASHLTAGDVLQGDSFQALSEVGSWIPYACVEETGRHHEYMHPAKELISTTAGVTVHEAFAQEGLADR